MFSKHTVQTLNFIRVVRKMSKYFIGVTYFLNITRKLYLHSLKILLRLISFVNDPKRIKI